MSDMFLFELIVLLVDNHACRVKSVNNSLKIKELADLSAFMRPLHPPQRQKGLAIANDIFA